ncbi:hypothetical protein [Vulcanococcus sp.]|jgi:hypothetical protein|uniref:hypothetical protein n=1 Tax=Vulcanococcus sp. TaxID=2856995 RepID=UPI00323080C6
MDDLARERLGCIDPAVLADLLRLTPEQRSQMVRQLTLKPQVMRSDGTVPVEVAMKAAQEAKGHSPEL